MKNINYVINGVLAVAVIILFVMQFSSKKESTVAPAFTTEGDSTNLLPVAYVNVDSLLSNYNYSKDLNERILKMQEDYRLDMTQRSNALRTELIMIFNVNMKPMLSLLRKERSRKETVCRKSRRNFRTMRLRKNKSWLPSRWS